MTCLMCEKKIGFLRSLTDKRFCSDEHRKAFPAFSARAERQQVAYLENNDGWSDAIAYKPTPRSSSSSASPAILAFFAVLFIVLAVVGVPSGSGSRRAATPPAPSMGIGETLKNAIRNRAAVRFTEDFKSGLSSWAPAGAGSADWTFTNGVARPGRLRLWQRSMPMADYQLEFQGSIESTAMGWVYRAKDDKTHYATKIVLGKGHLGAAEIVRYVMLDGKQDKRVRLPMPVPIRPETAYRFQIAVKGDRFSTLVNGHMVDSWTDQRLKSGGVGFFGEEGEAASVRWVSISDRNTFVGRLFSYATPGMFVPAFLPE